MTKTAKELAFFCTETCTVHLSLMKDNLRVWLFPWWKACLPEHAMEINNSFVNALVWKRWRRGKELRTLFCLPKQDVFPFPVGPKSTLKFLQKYRTRICDFAVTVEFNERTGQSTLLLLFEFCRSTGGLQAFIWQTTWTVALNERKGNEKLPGLTLTTFGSLPFTTGRVFSSNKRLESGPWAGKLGVAKTSFFCSVVTCLGSACMSLLSKVPPPRPPSVSASSVQDLKKQHYNIEPSQKLKVRWQKPLGISKYLGPRFALCGPVETGRRQGQVSARMHSGPCICIYSTFFGKFFSVFPISFVIWTVRVCGTVCTATVHLGVTCAA